MIRVLIADDHPLLRKGLRQILEMEPDIQVVGEAGNGAEAVAEAQRLLPDVIVLDINMPVMNGLEATRKIMEVAPNTKVVALTIHDDKDYILEILRSGAKSYLLKDSEPGKVAAAVRQVAAGEAYLSGRFMDLVLEDYRQTVKEQEGEFYTTAEANKAEQRTVPSHQDQESYQRPNQQSSDLGRLALLTEREKEILRWIVAGQSNRQIATGLYISEKTVKNHVSSILRKLNLEDRTQAAVYALRHGIEPAQTQEG